MSINKELLIAFERRNLGRFQELLQVFHADPNYFVLEKDRTIFEIILSTPDSSNYIQLCIENGADFYMKNNNNSYPLHCVIESHCLSNLKQVECLFTNTHTVDLESTTYSRYSPYVNAKMDHGQNSLHILADVLSNNDFETIFGMMKILLFHGCNPNFANYDGKTAFRIFLEKLSTLSFKARKYSLDYFLSNADVDFYSHTSDEIIELVKNHKLEFEIPEREECVVEYDSMVQLLNDLKINKFETLFPFFKSSCEDSEIYADRCAMFMEISIEKSLINIVDLLIDYGVDVNRIASTSAFKVPPIFLAVSNANPGVARLFLMHPKTKLSFDNVGVCKTLLHHFFDANKKKSYAMFRRSESREMSNNQKKCFDLLMIHPKCNRHLINENDEVGLPAIYYSIRFKNDYITLQLLKKGAYVGMAVNGMRKSLLADFLNSTITTNDRFNDDEDFEIKIDYNFLCPPNKDAVTPRRRGKKPKNEETRIAIPKSSEEVQMLSCDRRYNRRDKYLEEMRPLRKIAESPELQQFLAHPTIASFILLKFNKISFIVYINLVLIIMFMASFISFSIICQTMPDEERSTSYSYIFFQALSFISLGTLLAREITRAIISLREYVCSSSNWLNIALMSSTLVILLFEHQISNHVSRLLRTFVILLAAIEYFKILGMVPVMSVAIYTKMYKKVIKTFMKSLAFYSMMLVAFAFSFYTLQGDKFSKDVVKIHNKGHDNTTNDIPVTNATRNERYNNFYTVGSSIIKTFVMLTGELETSYIHTEEPTYAILFVSFLFLVTIVLYNLLNALAVSDTQEIKRDAKLIDLKQRIITMHKYESGIFKRSSKAGDWLKMVISMFPKTLPEGSITIKPNQNYRIYIKQNEPIIINDWLNHRLKFLKSEAHFNPDILNQIQELLISKREEQSLASLRKLKESRNEKLANDVIKITASMNNIQLNMIKLQTDVYSLKRNANF